MAGHGGIGGHGSSVAAVFFQALLDDTGLEKQAQEVGAHAGDAMSQSMGQRLKKAAFVGLSAGFAVLSRQLMELQGIQAEFQAQTGATAEEAQKAGEAINRLSGKNLQSLHEVGRAFTAVTRELKLTGKAAEDTTDMILKFAHVTGQDAERAVVALDDVLDSWNLSADKATHVMDLLVKAHQDYGGSIEENEAALKNLGPALQAANFSIEDAVAILGMFNDKGVDADKAVQGFQKALTKVKSPEELKTLLQDIADTADPFERASKAADLFGSRAGARLGQALGGAHIDDYVKDLKGAEGATEKASEAIESTFSNRVQLLIKGVTAKITEFGMAFGPALTALASIAFLGKAFGLDVVVAAAFKALIGSAPVVAAAQAAGFATGTTFQTAFGAGLVVGLPVLVAAFLSGVHAEMNKQITGSKGGLLKPTEEWGQAKPFWELIGQDAGKTFASNVSAGIAEGAGSIGPAIRDASTDVRSGIEDLKSIVVHAMSPLQNTIRDDLDISGIVAQGKIRNQQAIAKMAGDLATGLAQGGANLKQVSAGLAKALPDAIANNAAEVRHQAVLSMVQFAAGLRDQRAQIKAAVEQIGTDMEDALSAKQERLQLQGLLAGKEITAGLKSSDPVVKAQAQGTVGLITDRLTALGVDASKLSGQAGKNVATALADTKGIIGTAATTSLSGAKAVYADSERLARIYGHNTGAAYAAGIRATYGLVNEAAKHIQKGAVGPLEASSPPGPESPLHYIDVWGTRTIEAYADGIRGGIAAVRGATAAVAGAAAGVLAPRAMPLAFATIPGSRMASVPSVTSTGRAAGAPNVVNNNVTIAGLVKARDPFEVSSTMERFQRTGVLQFPEHEK